MNKYWSEDIEKARSEAKAEHKLLVLEYDATADVDLVSAMTPEEFESEKAVYQKRSIYGGWITVSEDYTQKPAEVEEVKKQGGWHPTNADFDAWLKESIAEGYVRAVAGSCPTRPDDGKARRENMFEKRFCPYCGALLSDGCDCARELAEYERNLVEELEERQLHTAWQQDIIDLYRFER